MNRKKRHKRILRQLVKSGWCVECCYDRENVGIGIGRFGTGHCNHRSWCMNFDAAKYINSSLDYISLPPFKHAENRLVFVIRNLDGRRNVVSGWKELSRFAQNERKWCIIKHMEGELDKCHSMN